MKEARGREGGRRPTVSGLYSEARSSPVVASEFDCSVGRIETGLAGVV